MQIHTGQKLNGHLLEIRQNFCSNFVSAFKQNCEHENLQRNMFVNLDEPAIYFEAKPTSTVHPTECNTIAIRGSRSSNHGLTACVAVASDGSKLLLFVIFEGQPMRHIEKNLHNMLPYYVHGCCQSKDWMDQRGMKIRIVRFWKPYVQNAPKSFLLLDDFICHRHPTTVGLLQEVDTDTAFCSDGYTCVLQPCDVDIIKSLKNGVCKHCFE